VDALASLRRMRDEKWTELSRRRSLVEGGLTGLNAEGAKPALMDGAKDAVGEPASSDSGGALARAAAAARRRSASIQPVGAEVVMASGTP
jgi:hypothetical protein